MTLIRDTFNRAWLYVVGPLWGYLQEYYVSGLLFASPYVWVSIFWGLNWILGSSMAIFRGEWQIRKCLKSFAKFGIWLLALCIATGLDRANFTGSWVPSGIIQFAVLVTEGAYLLRNLGRVARGLGNVKQGALLGLVADKTEEYIESRVHTTKTVTETVTTTTVCPFAHHERPEGCPARTPERNQDL